jgi:hypothetical protein
MSDLEAWDAGLSIVCLLLGFVVTIFLVVGVIGFLYQPAREDAMCSRSEARCGDN